MLASQISDLASKLAEVQVSECGAEMLKVTLGIRQAGLSYSELSFSSLPHKHVLAPKKRNYSEEVGGLARP